jgi:hypothetical protein
LQISSDQKGVINEQTKKLWIGWSHFFLGGKNSSKCKEKGWQKPFIKQNGVKLVMFAPMCAW